MHMKAVAGFLARVPCAPGWGGQGEAGLPLWVGFADVGAAGLFALQGTLLLVLLSLSETRMYPSPEPTAHLISSAGSRGSSFTWHSFRGPLPRAAVKWGRKHFNVAIELTSNRIVAPFRVVSGKLLTSLKPHFPHL